MRVGIVGAGPAGTVCALALLRGGERLGQTHHVLLFEGKSFLRTGPPGCNMCAGVVSGTLLEGLAALGASVPDRLIQRRLQGHYFETRAGAVYVPKHPRSTLCTVFRGVGPLHAPPDLDQSFDQFLLHSAVAAGAHHVPATVTQVVMPVTSGSPFELRTADGHSHRVDVVIGAFGVNSVLTARFERLAFGYRAPETYRVAQADLALDERFIRESLGGTVKIFSLGLPRIRFGAITPKRQHATVTVIGPRLGRHDLERFLLHPRVRRHFPLDWDIPRRYCYCQPRLPVTAARNPVADRLIVIGDAHVSRYLKGGIDSALFTGTLAAHAVLHGDLSRRALMKQYVRPCRAKYVFDNFCGRLLFTGNDLVSRIRSMAALGLLAVENEQDLPQWEQRHHTRVLWNIFTGEAPYRRIVATAASPLPVLRALVKGFGGRTRGQSSLSAVEPP